MEEDILFLDFEFKLKMNHAFFINVIEFLFLQKFTTLITEILQSPTETFLMLFNVPVFQYFLFSAICWVVDAYLSCKKKVQY